MVSQRIKTALTENHLQLLTFSASSSLHRGLKNVQASCILQKDIFPKKDLGSWESTECIRIKNTAESPYRKEILKKDSFLCNTQQQHGVSAASLKNYLDAIKLFECEHSGALRGCGKGTHSVYLCVFLPLCQYYITYPT